MTPDFKALADTVRHAIKYRTGPYATLQLREDSADALLAALELAGQVERQRELSDKIGQLEATIPAFALPDNYEGGCDIDGCTNQAIWRTETCDTHRIIKQLQEQLAAKERELEGLQPKPRSYFSS